MNLDQTGSGGGVQYIAAQLTEVQRSQSRVDRLVQDFAAQDEGVELVRFDRHAPPQLAGKTLGFWPRRASKDTGPLSRLWACIDEAAGSVLVEGPKIAQRMNTALGDVNLSTVGRHAAVAKVVKESSLTIKTLCARWTAAASKVEDGRKGLASLDPYVQSAPWEWAHDLATAQAVRSMTAQERRGLVLRLAQGEMQDVAVSVLRSPSIVSGLSADQIAKVKAGLVEARSPGNGLRLRLEHAAMLCAASSIKVLAEVLMTGGYVPDDELRVLFGSDWQAVRDYAARPILDDNQPEGVEHALMAADAESLQDGAA